MNNPAGVEHFRQSLNSLLQYYFLETLVQAPLLNLNNLYLVKTQFLHSFSPKSSLKGFNENSHGRKPVD
jgi:hypothetical protein